MKLDITSSATASKLPSLSTRLSTGTENIVSWPCADRQLWKPKRSKGAFFTFKHDTLPQGLGHQSEFNSSGRLAPLLRSGIQGAFAAAVRTLVCDDQDSHAQLLGQCYLYGDYSVGYDLHFAVRAVVVTRRMGQAGQPQFSRAACKISTAGPVSEDSKRCVQGQGNYSKRFATPSTVFSLWEVKT